MDIGCHLPTQGPVATREALSRFCREAEKHDIASLWVSDHVVFPREKTGQYPGGRFPHSPDTAYLEPVAVLAAAAMVTERARLGSSVFILGHRHPVVMAKMLTTIDALSQGRLILGVGVGWWEEELTALGAPYKQRGRHADEILRIFKTLWKEDHPTFDGEFFRFPDLGFQPKPVQKPHPPIWVGGNSPGAFKRVVTYGDGWHATYLQPPELRASLDRLRAAADAAKRPFDSIELSMRCAATKGPIKEWREPVVELLVAYKRAGLTHVMLDVRRDSLTEMLESVAVVAEEIRPAVNKA